MADPTDEAKPPTGATGAAASDAAGAAPGVSVNWRGIVDDDAPEPKTVRFFHALGRGITAVLVALGLKRKRRRDGTREPRPWGRVIAIWGTLLVLFVVFSAGHVVGAGNVGVPVTLGSAGDPIDPGLHFTAPWPVTRVAQISTRTQNYTMSASRGEGDQRNIDDSVIVLGRDGGQGNVDATVLYRVAPENATKVYETVGTNFASAIIRPSARSCIRNEFTTRDVVDASTSSWPEISENIATCMRDKIEPLGITLQDFQLRDVQLSQGIQQAVDANVAAAQTQDNDLSESYLRFAYIQALRALAFSDNAKTVVIPSGGDVTPTLPLDGSESGSGEGSTTVTP
jgi:regulator of protease activity HflC (stomatin/prohibitin superfamily)